MNSIADADDLLAKIDSVLEGTDNPHLAVQKVMQCIHNSSPDFYWVGVYILRDNELQLGPYVGPKTDHVRIKVGQGVCGTAVKENSNLRIDDVSALDNYLACNLNTKAELVVLIRDPQSEQILGQIDIDGTKVGMFNDSDEKFFDLVAERLANRVPQLN